MPFNFKKYKPKFTAIVLTMKDRGKSRDEVAAELAQSLNRIINSNLDDDPIYQETYCSEMQKLHAEVLEEIYGRQS